MSKENKIKQLLNIKYPIIQGGMAGISESNLVSAVSNSGGLGVIGAGFFPPSWLEEEIKKTRDLTDKPFGVNLFMRNPKITGLIEVIIKYQVPVVFTGGGNPLPVFPHLQAAGIKVIPVVALSRLAQKMRDNGADAIVIEGMESGGHIGENSTLTLISQTRKLFQDTPLIAAGGIYDGKTAQVAFSLGADAVQMGTRFLASEECLIHENYKKKIIESSDEDITVVARFTGYPVRMINNDFAKKAKKFEEKNPFPEEVRAENFAGTRALVGNVDEIPLLCGLCAGGIGEIKTCREIIEEIAKEIEK